MNTPRIPPELQDTVIDCLPYEDLIVATLVNKPWCGRGRKSLFCAVRVSAPVTGSAFKKFMHNNPSYAKSVRSLSLRGEVGFAQSDHGHDSGEDDEDDFDLDDDHRPESLLATSIDPTEIAVVLSMFPNLRRLELKDLSLVPASVPPLMLSKALEELILSHIVNEESIEAEDTLLEVLSFFSRVGSIQLRDIPNRLLSVDHEPGCLVKRSLNLQATRCVIKDVKSCGVFLELLRRGCSPSRLLEHLEVHTHAPADIRVLGQLLQAAPVERLHIDATNSIRNVDDHMEPCINGDVVDRILAPGLAAWSALHTCTFGIWLEVSEVASSNQNAWVCLAGLVTRLPGTVRNLTVELHGANAGALEQLLKYGEIDQLGEALHAWPHLDTLKTFTLRFCLHHNKENVEWNLAAKTCYLRALRSLRWSASFDVEIIATTWDWGSSSDSLSRAVVVPFDNQMPITSIDEWGFLVPWGPQ